MDAGRDGSKRKSEERGGFVAGASRKGGDGDGDGDGFLGKLPGFSSIRTFKTSNSNAATRFFFSSSLFS